MYCIFVTCVTSIPYYHLYSFRYFYIYMSLNAFALLSMSESALDSQLLGCTSKLDRYSAKFNRKNSRVIAIPDEDNSSFSALLNAQLYPKGCRNASQSVKLNCSSSLPSQKKPKPLEDVKSKTRILVSYSDDEDDFEFQNSKNKFAVKTALPGKYLNDIKLLDTLKSTPNKGVDTSSFYNKSSSPKSYKRIRSTRNLNPLPVLKVPSQPNLLESKFPPFRSKFELKRNPIHRDRSTNIGPLYKVDKLETIDLIECDEMNYSPFKQQNNKVTPTSPIGTIPLALSDYESIPEFELSYNSSPSPPAIGEEMDFLNEAADTFQMGITSLHFGTLTCKPLDDLKINKEYFKLHVQFTSNKTTCKQLLQIQTCDVQSMEIKRLLCNGYIFITPKADTTQRLSIDLNLTPTLYLNPSDAREIKRCIVLIFEIKHYPLEHIHDKLNIITDITVSLNETNDYKLVLYTDFNGEQQPQPQQQDTSHKSNPSPQDTTTSHKSNPSPQLHNITLSSTDSPVQQEEIVLGEEEEHSYCQYKRSSRKSPQLIEEYNLLMQSSADKLLTYPDAKHYRRITIHKDTVGCLLPEMFLNDTIIEFYLLYMYHEIFSPEQREQVHIFNTFFYTKLTNNLNDSLTPQDIYEKHGQVSKWTKNVDLFDKDFIVVPIHDHAHWFLAIICYPNLSGKEQVVRKEDSDELCLSPKSARKGRGKVVEKKACILIFDSLEIKRLGVINNLKCYMKAEWEARYKSISEYSCDMIGHHPKLPVQPNSSDCGLFVLQYAESFFKKPIRDFSFPLKLDNWFSLAEIKHKRNSVIKLIFDLSQNETYK